MESSLDTAGREVVRPIWLLVGAGYLIAVINQVFGAFLIGWGYFPVAIVFIPPFGALIGLITVLVVTVLNGRAELIAGSIRKRSRTRGALVGLGVYLALFAAALTLFETVTWWMWVSDISLIVVLVGGLLYFIPPAARLSRIT